MSSTPSRAPSRGLPTNPRPRSKSAAVPAPSRPSVDYRAALPSNPRTRHPSTQRERVPNNYPTTSPSRRDYYDQSLTVSDARHSDDSSPTSSTSSGSSFWARGNSSLASSKTTLRSEDMEYKELSRETYLQSRNSKDNIEPSTDLRDAAAFSWGRVTEVANVLTQEVSKVWATGLAPLGNGVGDQAEEESHLTRVMRAYHLSKARTPSDLPDWLFSERERGQLGGLQGSETRSDDDRAKASLSSTHRRNRIDVGQAELTRHTEPRLKNIQNFPTPTTRSLPPAKASGTDRLKMLREKRNAPSDRI
ncbi:hypothetical protein BDZ97DRAFT_1421503 [Flammula alnicola]|nr:hypothetical protein BDZ97DRAFT_1421503 [Flammula alnicola]